MTTKNNRHHDREHEQASFYSTYVEPQHNTAFVNQDFRFGCPSVARIAYPQPAMQRIFCVPIAFKPARERQTQRDAIFLLDRRRSLVIIGLHLGVAHGWAGFLYATLCWRRAADVPLPPQVEARLEQLAALAEPYGRGLRWAWQMPRETPEASYMPGWCNGSSGYVFLWSLAHSLLADERYLDLARGAAWDACDAPDRAGSLCCGLVGRSYALLNLYKHTGEVEWLTRARDLGERAARGGPIDPRFSHSLYKGDVGLAILAADLAQPDYAAQPFFEPES